MRRADLPDPGGRAAVRRAEATSGIPRAVVHLVGGFRYARLADLSDADWTYLLQLNLDTTFRVFRESARRFERARGGVAGRRRVAGGAPRRGRGRRLRGHQGRGAAHGRVAGARAGARSAARANAVLPGTMDTAANRAAMPAADPAQWAKTDDVAEVIHFLTTPAAAAVNGAAVRVPGPSL